MLKRIFSLTIVISMVLSMIASTGVFAAKDLTKVTFEKKGEDWSAFSATGEELNTITDDAYSEGKNSVLMNDNSTTLTAGVQTVKIDVDEGKEYTALVDAYIASGSYSFYFRFYNAKDKLLESPSVKLTGAAWKNYALYTKVPEGAVTAHIVIAASKAAKAVGYADNLRIVKGEVKAEASITGKAPSNVPVSSGSATSTTTPAEKAEPKDDGVKDGTMLHATSFEKGLDDWEYQSANSADYVKVVTDKVSDGKKAIHIPDTETTEGPGVRSPKITISEGNTYSLVADIFGVSGSIKEYIRFYDENGKQITSANAAVGMGGDWATSSFSATAPKGAVELDVVFCGVKATKGEIYLDNVKVFKGFYKPPVVEKEYLEPKQTAAVDAKIVAPVDNKLQYNTYNEQGDKLSDFSFGGFYGGQYELPETNNIPVVMEVSPTGTSDDTKMLQDAIDKVYNESSHDYFKAIRLKAGKYNINKTGIKLKNGIVLVGEGQGPTGTILYAFANTTNNPVTIAGKPPVKISDNYNITDDYVKAGSNKINLSSEDASNFKVGDLITIYHPSTAKWVEALRMINMKSSSGGDNSWKAGSAEVYFERIITAINGTEITLDFPTFIPLIKEYSQSYVYKIDDSSKIQHAGVENLRIESYYNGDPQDNEHGVSAISITDAKNCFVRNVSAKYFRHAAVSLSGTTKQVTVLNCSMLEPVSSTGSYRYCFNASGHVQQALFTGCYSYNGRHDMETSTTVTGPIVFLDNIVDNSINSSEAHGTWSTGVMFDNIYQVPNDTQGYLCFANRGIYGTSTSQGWTAAGSVMWNTLTHAAIVHKPPLTYQNFSVGTWGIYSDAKSEELKSAKMARYRANYRTTDFYNAEDSHYETKEGTSLVGDAYKESEFTPVNPRSLFKAQLSERITGVISNARPNAPVIVYPRPDKETEDKKVNISGVYQLGATDVTVYIDDQAYKATLNGRDNSFEFTKELSSGVHKIYATQTIDGIEGCKTADRFIIIGKANGNPSYLQSIYDVSKTRLIANDPRPTFDTVQAELVKNLQDKITVKVNGSNLISDVEPFETNGRVLVPMRAIFEALKADVSWDEATLTATATLNNTVVKITENATTAYVNDKPVTLDVPATIVNGRFVVPVRFISESFGASVSWIDARKTVEIVGSKFTFVLKGYENELSVVAVKQSAADSAESFVESTIDGDMNTAVAMSYDASDPEAGYLVYDLGSSKEIDSVYVALQKGNARVTTIDFYVSDDGVTYTPAKIGHKTSGTTIDFEQVKLDAKGRYVKLVSKGNSSNKWMSITEIAFVGK